MFRFHVLVSNLFDIFNEMFFDFRSKKMAVMFKPFGIHAHKTFFLHNFGFPIIHNEGCP